MKNCPTLGLEVDTRLDVHGVPCSTKPGASTLIGHRLLLSFPFGHCVRNEHLYRVARLKPPAASHSSKDPPAQTCREQRQNTCAMRAPKVKVEHQVVVVKLSICDHLRKVEPGKLRERLCHHNCIEWSICATWGCLGKPDQIVQKNAYTSHWESLKPSHIGSFSFSSRDSSCADTASWPEWLHQPL